MKSPSKFEGGGSVDSLDNPRALGTALKKVFKNDYGIDIDTRYVKTVRGLDRSWYEITTFKSGDKIPNQVRKELLELSQGKTISELKVQNPDDIYYGNIRSERVAVYGRDWKEWLKGKKFEDGGYIDAVRTFTEDDYKVLIDSGEFKATFDNNQMWTITKPTGGRHLGKWHGDKGELYIIGSKDLSNPLVKWLKDNLFVSSAERFKLEDGGGVEEDEYNPEEDLFGRQDELPEDVKAVLDKYNEDWESTYENCGNMLSEIEPLGYTFDYYLDAEPYNLRKIKMADGGGVGEEWVVYDCDSGKLISTHKNHRSAKMSKNKLWNNSNEYNCLGMERKSEWDLIHSDSYAKGGAVENLEKELRKLQRDLNSSRLGTYMEGDSSEEQAARNKEREVKLARFNEVLQLLRENDSKYAKGGDVNDEKWKISYLSKKHGFRQVDKVFEGKNAFDDAVKWGRKNLENFNLDMVRYVSGFAKGGGVKNKNEIIYKGKLITVLFPSGYYEVYSDDKGRFIKFDELDSAKELIDDESSMADGGGVGNVLADIEKEKRKLISKAKSKGITENFGQKEAMALEDKYGHTPEVNEFDNWLLNFDLDELSKYDNGGVADFSFEYQMLDRLRFDNDAYLDGVRAEDRLWAGSVDGQIEEMKRLWNKLSEKPEWLSMEDILEYERKMNNEYANGGGVSDLQFTSKTLRRSIESKVRENIFDGEISEPVLRSLIGHEPDYPVQFVGSLKLNKCFLRPYYKI